MNNLFMATKYLYNDFKKNHSTLPSALFSIFCLSSSTLGNVKLVRRPIRVTTITNIIGIGLSSSAINGENIVKDRAIKLQIPIAVVRFRTGNVIGSPKLV